MNNVAEHRMWTAKEAIEALQAAVKAYNGGHGEWPSMNTKERMDHIEDLLHKMNCRKSEIVNLIIWETEKTVEDAENEFDRTVDYINQTIRSAGELHNGLDVTQDFITQKKRLPHGVVLCMAPSHYPLDETFATLLPALIMGNTVLFNPSKRDIFLFEPLLECFEESFPEGVVNTVYGRTGDVLPVLMQSGKVDVLALVGAKSVAGNLQVIF